jgi:hypothetical protein
MKSVTEGALFKRINRALQREDGTCLRKTRYGSPAQSNLGEFFSVTENNAVRDTHLNLENLGRQLGVLKDTEQLVQ